MPLYQYECKQCGYGEEHMLSIAERDSEFKCPNCDGPMVRTISVPKFGREKPQMGAVLENGAHVPGHFGREAPRQRKG